MKNSFGVLIKFISLATVFPFQRPPHGEGYDESLASNYISGFVEIKGERINGIWEAGKKKGLWWHVGGYKNRKEHKMKLPQGTGRKKKNHAHKKRKAGL